MNSIRGKLYFGLTATAAMFAVGAGILLYNLIRASIYQQVDERLRVQTLAITTATKQEDGFVAVYFSDRYLREFDDVSATRFYQIWSSIPVGWREWDETLRSDSLDDHESLPRLTGTLREPKYWNLTLPNGKPGRAIGLRFHPQASRQAAFKPNPELNADIVVAEDLSSLNATLARIRARISAVIGLGLLATLLIIPALLRAMTRPLHKVSEKAASIDASSLDTRFNEKEVPIELQPICSRLNDLMKRLQNSFDRERQFSSDIAHELRTPIAELKSYAEVRTKWPDQDHAAFDREILRVVQRMENLVTSLLTLSKCDSENVAVETETVDLAAQMAEALRPYTPQAKQRKLILISDCKEKVQIQTHPTFLATVLSNLYRNAVEYAPEGSAVESSCRRTGSHFRLTIANEAPELAEEAVEHIFDRFWRNETARSEETHSGLGLSLSRAIAEQLGFQLKAEWNDGALTMALTGPRLNTPPPSSPAKKTHGAQRPVARASGLPVKSA